MKRRCSRDRRLTGIGAADVLDSGRIGGGPDRRFAGRILIDRRACVCAHGLLRFSGRAIAPISDQERPADYKYPRGREDWKYLEIHD